MTSVSLHHLKVFLDDSLQFYDHLIVVIKFYKQNGIDKEFVKRFYRTPPEEMWYPRDEELLKQGIVTEVINH